MNLRTGALFFGSILGLIEFEGSGFSYFYPLGQSLLLKETFKFYF